MSLRKWLSRRRSESSQLADNAKKAAFDEAIRSIRYLLYWTPLDVDKATVLDYAINVIGRDLSYSVAARMLYHGKTPGNSDFTIPAPLSAYHGHRNYSLSGINVISDTYDSDKLSKAISQVFLQGFRQINNYTGTYYPDINLVVVENGRHHLSAAAVKNSGSAKLQICDLKEAFSVLKTDGAYWYSDGSSPDQVFDYRVAVLYELARLKNGLMLPGDINDLRDREYPIPSEVNALTAFRESLFRSELLELELGIKKQQISILKGTASEGSWQAEFDRLEQISKDIKKEFNDWIENEGEHLLKCGRPYSSK